MADLRVAAVMQQALDTLDREIIHAVGGAAGLANDVIVARSAQRELEEAGAVVEVAAADHAELFEGRKAAVDGHQIAHLGAQFLVDTLDADRTFMALQRLDDREARLGDAHAGLTDAAAGFFQRGARGDWESACLLV